MKTYFGASRKARSYRLQFVSLFLLFGCLIALFTSVLSYYLDVKNIRLAFNEAAIEETGSKERELATFIANLDNYVSSLRDSDALEDYLREPSLQKYSVLNSLFYSIAKTNPDFMQVRFIDRNGREDVRVDYRQGDVNPEVVPRARLQNKEHRYYYTAASNAAKDSFWYSNLDLNVDNNVIEAPLKPVLRIASPVYLDEKYQGIVIINVHAQGLVDRLRESPFFTVSIVDHYGEFIVHHDDIHSWSKYLSKSYNLLDEVPKHALAIINSPQQEGLQSFGSNYILSLAHLLPQDKAFLFISPQKNVLKRMQQKNRQATMSVVIMTCLLSLPLAFVLSKIPMRLNRKIEEQNQTLTEYVKLIDENILTSTTDEEYTITSVSSAYSTMCGYSKDELYGKNYTMLRSEHVSPEIYLAARKHIESGKVWRGELPLRTKGNKEIWTNTTVSPKLDRDGNRVFWSIYEDITYRKELEVTAITDELTGLYNRRHFNTVLNSELDRAKRQSMRLCFAILDVDHFKQYNDNYGHQKGDEVLEAIGRQLRAKLSRMNDFSFRLGGEEFGFLFSVKSKEEAVNFAESVRESIGELNIKHKWSTVRPVVTASMGILTIIPSLTTTTDEIYRLGDEALYAAKESGRDQASATHLETTTVS